MIRQDSVVQAYPLAEKWAKRNIRIVPRPQSPLALAVQSSVGFLHGETTDGLEALAKSINVFTAGTDLEHTTAHNCVMDEVVSVASDAVLNHLRYAREVVKPLILEYGESVITALNAFEPSAPHSQFNIISYEMPALVQDVSFMDELNRYKGNTPLEPLRVDVMSPATGEEILQMMLTGNPEQDADIKAWYTTQEPGLFEGLWAGFFSDSQTNVKPLTFEALRGKNVFEKTYAGLALYLLAKRLYNNPPEGINLTLAAWNERVGSVRDYAGALFMRSLANYLTMVKANVMVIAVSPNQKYCMVNGAVYNTWLNNGGTPEVILGLISSNADYLTVSAIDAHADRLLSNWKQFVTIYKTREITERFDAFKGILYSHFVRLMESLTPQEKEYIDTVDDFSGAVMKRFDKELEFVRLSDMDDVYNTAMRLICRARFYYTSAEQILSYVNEAMVANPNLAPREAASVAAAQYLADYISAQFIKTR